MTTSSSQLSNRVLELKLVVQPPASLAGEMKGDRYTRMVPSAEAGAAIAAFAQQIIDDTRVLQLGGSLAITVTELPERTT